MRLNPQQFNFTWMVSQLIDYTYKNGYTLTFGDARATMGHRKDSLHYTALAIDLNLFKDGKFLTQTKDHEPLGKFWESIGGSWGGRWDDGTHYSLGES